MNTDRPSPSLSASTSATRPVMTPSSSSRLHPPPAGIARQADPLRQLVDRQRAVALQLGKDSSIDRIDFTAPSWDECPKLCCICKDKLGPMNRFVVARYSYIGTSRMAGDRHDRAACQTLHRPSGLGRRDLFRPHGLRRLVRRQAVHGRRRRARSRFVTLPVRNLRQAESSASSTSGRTTGDGRNECADGRPILAKRSSSKTS